MPLNEGTLLTLAEAVADGSEVDWEQAESSAAGDEERLIVQRLRALAGVRAAAQATAPTWGPLQIRGEVGSGTFGTVYRAWDTRLEREVALKLLHADSPEHPLASTVVKEGRLLAQIRHPNVVTVHGADAFDGRVGIWMEFVTGRTLKEIVQQQGPFGAHEAALIGRDLCRALAAVHKLGFVHRDIKAQNVMREAGGRTVLMDFGAGDSTSNAATAPLKGSPVYLAPELLNGDSPSPRTDLYALGVLLYHLVSGEFPYTGRSLAELRDIHAQQQGRRLRDARPDLPAEFVRVIDRAIARNPGERPQSAGEMEALLEGSLGRREDAPGGIEPVSPSIDSRRWLRHRGLLAVAALVLVIAGWAGWRNAWPPAAPVVRNSVAIVPFKNLTPGSDDYFSDGITQDVVAHLAALPDLRVIAGASALRYKGHDKSATEIGRELGVATVLDGSVQRVGNRVRIVSQLLDGVTGEQLWSDSFDREVEDVFAMQSEVSRKIAIALKGQLSDIDAQRLAVARGRNFEAFNLYMQGRQAFSLRTEESLNRSVQLQQEAIRRDPEYALAYAGLSDAYTTLGTYGFLPRGEAYSRAATAAEKAIALDPSLAEAHLSLAYARKNRFEWTAAEASFKRAIELKPGVAQAHHWYSIYLTHQGRFAEAIAEIKAALSLDPLSIGANLQYGSLLLMARRYEDAISQWQHSIQLDAGFVNAYRGISSAYAHLGLYDRAFAAATEAARHSSLGAEDQELKADLGYVLAVAGRKGEALAITRELINRHDHAHEEVAGAIASIYSGLGDLDAGILWLTRARDEHDPELSYVKVDPKWDPLRRDRRFDAILASLGFTN